MGASKSPGGGWPQWTRCSWANVFDCELKFCEDELQTSIESVYSKSEPADRAHSGRAAGRRGVRGFVLRTVGHGSARRRRWLARRATGHVVSRVAGAVGLSHCIGSQPRSAIIPRQSGVNLHRPPAASAAGRARAAGWRPKASLVTRADRDGRRVQAKSDAHASGTARILRATSCKRYYP